MRIALDTNVLAYAEGANGAIIRDKTLKLIRGLPPEAIVQPVQTLGELFHVLVRKAKRRPGRAREAVLSWRDAYAVVETSASVIVNATDLAADHGLTIWDSVVLAASGEAERPSDRAERPKSEMTLRPSGAPKTKSRPIRRTSRCSNVTGNNLKKDGW
jgi:predicted nucleic acid-binding protein